MKTRNFIITVAALLAGLHFTTAQITTSEIKTEDTGGVTTIDGSVGIGTNNPQTQLHIQNGGIMKQTSSDQNHAITLSNQAADRRWNLYQLSSTDITPNGFLLEYFNGSTHQRRFTIDQNGNVGIGTPSPLQKLDVRGHLLLEASQNPILYTGTGENELNRFLYLINSPNHTSASGLKAGGMLVSDIYNYANPGKNDLIVKGNIGIGTPSPLQKLDIRGHLLLEASQNPVLYTGTGENELNRFLYLINSPNHTSASGLKAGGMLVSDTYNYANPGKNDLIVKGKVGIGTANPTEKLHVNGRIKATTFCVDLSTCWPDFVFENNFELRSLAEVEKFIKKNKHLPDIPSEKELQKTGLDLPKMDARLLQKIEELTLYTIEQDKTLKQQQKKIQKLEKENEVLKSLSGRLSAIEKQLKSKK